MASAAFQDALVHTCGHGNRSAAELVALLTAHGIATLVDIRARPLSRRNPQFNRDSLRGALAETGIEYRWAGRQLGGLREPRLQSRHLALADDAMRGYADHMESDLFRQAAGRLVHLALQTPTAVMCAERLPQSCHRALLADYLLLHGVRVIHLIEPDLRVDHVLHRGVRRESAELVYDRNSQQLLL